MLAFRFRGVPVRLGWSWLVVVGLVYGSLATALFPSAYPRLSTATHLLMAAVATVLFFASLLVHEMSHTLRSLREGVPVRDITLFLLGGVSRSDRPLPSPGAELRVVAAGPAASAALAVLFLGVAEGGAALGLPDAVVGVPAYLAWVNGLLLVFNLVPAIPLDGGRLLHAALWRRSGDAATATIQAGAVSRVLVVALIAAGVAGMLVGDPLGGLWLVVMGWFLLEAVRAEVLVAQVTHTFDGVEVADLMASTLVTVRPDMTIEEFAGLLERTVSHPAYPVLDGDRFVGMLLLREAGAVPVGRRRELRVADVMLQTPDVPTVQPDAAVVEAARTMGRAPGRAIVTDGDGRVVGLLSASDLGRVLEEVVGPRDVPRALDLIAA